MDARLEQTEAEAYAGPYESAGIAVLRIAGAVCYATPGAADATMLNRVVGLGLDRRPEDAELDEIDAFFDDAGTAYAVSVSPLAAGPLAARLRERGFTDGYAWMKFRRGTEPLPAPAAPAPRVTETSDGATFGRVLAAAYGMPEAGATLFAGLAGRPDWNLFLAEDEGEPIGAAALFARDGVGWLGAAGTLPDRRGQGAQGALLAARVVRARALGLEALTTETGERMPGRPSASYRNILRAGFTEAYLRPNLVSPAR